MRNFRLSVECLSNVKCHISICHSCEYFFCPKHFDGAHLLKKSRGPVNDLSILFQNINVCVECARDGYKFERLIKRWFRCDHCRSRKQLIWDGKQTIICRACSVKERKSREAQEEESQKKKRKLNIGESK